LIIVFIGYFSLKLDISQTLSFAPYSIYTSALIGFGPDASFVFLNRTLYLCLGLFLCLMGSFLANVLLTVSYRFEFWRLNISLVVFTSALAISSILMAIQYQEISHLANILPDPLRHAQQKVACSDIETYTVEITLDATGRISAGNAIIRFSNQQARDSVPLTLNAGLKLIEPQAIDNDQLLSDMKPGYSSAQDMQIQYSGRMIIPRYSYSYDHQEPAVTALGFESGFFANANFALILGKGSWHPISECTPNSILINIPNSYPVVYTSADRITLGVDSVVYTWEHSEDGILLIAGNYSQYTNNNRMVLFPDRFMSTDNEAKLANIYGLVLDVGSSFLSIAPYNHRKIIIVPLIQQSYWQTTDQSIFIPERLVFAKKLLDTSHNPSLVEKSLNITTLVAQDVLIAWWCEDQRCQDLYSTLIVGSGEYDIQDENNFVAPLLLYAALRLSSEIDQNQEYADVIQQYADAGGDPLKSVFLPVILPDSSVRLLPEIANIGDKLCLQEFLYLLTQCKELSLTRKLTLDEFDRLAVMIPVADDICGQGSPQ
jgi:hypothetical protein